MSWFMNLKVQTKLLLAFGVVLALNAAVAVIGIVQVQAAGQRTDALYRENTLGVKYALVTKEQMARAARDMFRAFLEDDPAKRAQLITLSREAMAKAKQAAQDYHQTFASAEDAAQWKAVEEKVDGVIAQRTQVLDLLAAGKEAEAKQASDAIMGAVNEMNRALEDAADFNDRRAADSLEAANSATATARTLLIGLTVGAAAAGLGLASWLARSMARTAREVRDAARRMARGDVSVEVAVRSRDELGEAAAAFAEMTDYLKEMVNVADRVASGDLTSQVRPRGHDDALGNALQRMVADLLGLVTRVQQSADAILSAAGQLGEASDQMAAATGQIATAINEVTRSTVALSSLSQESAREVERVASGSQQVAAGAQESAAAAGQSRDEAAQMGERIQVVARASGEVAEAAEESRRAAQQG